MYMGLDLSLIVYKLLKERGIMIRGLAHPGLFETSFEEDLQVCHLIVFFSTSFIQQGDAQHVLLV